MPRRVDRFDEVGGQLHVAHAKGPFPLDLSPMRGRIGVASHCMILTYPVFSANESHSGFGSDSSTSSRALRQVLVDRQEERPQTTRYRPCVEALHVLKTPPKASFKATEPVEFSIDGLSPPSLGFYLCQNLQLINALLTLTYRLSKS